MPQKPKPSPADALFALDARLDVALDDLASGFIDDLTAVLRALQLRINALVRQYQREGGRLVATQVNLGLALRAKAQLEAGLRMAGYDRAADAALARLPQLVAYTSITKAAQAFTAFDLATLDAFRTLKAAELGDLFGSWASKAATTILKGVLGAQDADVLVTELQDLLDETRAHAETLYNTATSEFVQTAEILHSDGTPGEAFLYSGPVDARIRPFCLERVGRVYTRKAIDQMDNGQLPNVLISTGGYNCRHLWRRVSEYSDLKALADTGDLASPQIASDVRRAQAAAKARTGRRKGGA